MSDHTTLKRCRKCNVEYPATALFFYRDADTNDGLETQCKNCSAISRGLNGARHWPPTAKIEGFKICSKCVELKSLDEFHRHSSCKDGHREICKSCRIPQTTDYYNKHKNELRVYWVQHYKTHRQTIIARSVVYQATHREQKRRNQSVYNQKNKDKHRIKEQRRRARKLSLPMEFTDDNWKTALEYFHGCCAYCGNPPRLFDIHAVLHAEHFIPLSSIHCPGTIPTNILPACQECNFNKRDLDPTLWMNKRFGKRKAKTILNKIQQYFEWVEEARDQRLSLE